MKLSFYAKTNQTESPFITSITLCENNEDIAKEAKFQKAIVLQNGVQTIESGVNDIWGNSYQSGRKRMEKVCCNCGYSYQCTSQICVQTMCRRQ